MSRKNSNNTVTSYNPFVDGNEATIRELLLNGLDPNSKNGYKFQPLYYAIKQNNLGKVAVLLEFGAKANGRFKENYSRVSYLQRACEKCKCEIIKLLIDNGCDVNQKLLSNNINCQPGSRLLHLVIALDRPEVVKLLLSYNADVNITNKEGESPLHIACDVGNPEVVKMLLEKNALVNVKTKNYLTPIYKSIRNKNYKVIELLMEHGVSMENENSETIIYFYVLLEQAILDKKINILSGFFNAGLDPNVKFYSSKNRINKTLLHSAVSSESAEIVSFLLERKADVDVKDDRGMLPIHVAAELGNLEILKKLLEYEGDRKFSTILAVDKSYSTPLHAACKMKKNKCIQALIDLKADLTAQTSSGDTPLHVACEHDNFDAVRVLVENGSPLDVIDVDGNTPLHIAVNICNDKIVELLLQHGASLTIKNKNERIPLYRAAKEHDMKCVQLMLKYSTNVNHEYYREVFNEVLKLPTEKNLDVVKEFLRNGFVVTEQDNDKVVNLFSAVVENKYDLVEDLIYQVGDIDVSIGGQSLLHVASFCGNIDVVEILLENGANMHAKNQDGKLPIFYVFLNGNKHNIAKVFLKRGLDFQRYPEVFFYPIDILKNGSIIFGYDTYHKMFKSLMSRGADVDYCDDKGRNVLHFLIDCLFEDSMNYIVREEDEIYEPEDDIDERDDVKRAYLGVSLFSDLVDWGVDLNAKTHKGDGVIHMAIKACLRSAHLRPYRLIKILLQQPELHLDNLNGEGETALMIAYKRSLTGLSLILAIHGADVSTIISESQRYERPDDVYLQQIFGYPYQDDDSVDEDNDFDLRDFIDSFAEIQLHDLVLDYFPSLEGYRSFANLCKQELAQLADIKISGSNVRDILKKDIKKVARLVRNKETSAAVLKVFEKEKDDDDFFKFEVYRTMVFRRWCAAVWRKHLIDIAKPNLASVMGLGLPDICLEEILNNLSDIDLEQLCKTCPDSPSFSARYRDEVLDLVRSAQESEELSLQWDDDVLRYNVPKYLSLKRFGSRILNLVTSIFCAEEILKDDE